MILPIIGIDPGVTGAFALYAGDRLVEVHDLPVSGGHLDAAILADQLEGLLSAEGLRPHVYVELQGIRPGSAAGAAGKSMRGFGRIEGVIAALDWPIRIVTPAQWKRQTQTPQDKDGARARASQLMPEGAGFWTRKKDHGRAEAALIAWWGANVAMQQVRKAA
jgi:crossover junction endodeoxyribonuclease RuvC